MARFVIMILDGVGAGALPDAADYGDTDANTLGNLAALVPLDLPNLRALGLGNILPLRGISPVAEPLALPGVLAELSAGKDTTAGHWEHMGVVTTQAQPTFPDGFPPEVISGFEQAVGRKVLGNKAASGTEIIAELGEQHMESGRPIVYTSADSVFQIACHVDVIPVEELYRYCEIARAMLTGPNGVGRVIARPFSGTPGTFVRTKDRKDFSLEPPSPTYLDLLTQAGVHVLGIGKIYQIFAGRGVTEQVKVESNEDNLVALVARLEAGVEGLVFTNLVDFDMVWGHRNDVDGFAAGLEAADRALPSILALLGPEDRLLITADHGVDPTTVSTDHSREYVPLLYYPRPAGLPARTYMGTMADTGATAYRHLTAGQSGLGGTPLEEGRPAHGWRDYPAVYGRAVSLARDRAGTDAPGAGADGGTVGEPSGVCAGDLAAAAEALHGALGAPPDCAVILGSGLDEVATILVSPVELDYAAVPGWSRGAVPGHAGRIAVGEVNGVRVAILRGRAHGYEGHDLGHTQAPVRTLACWGVRRLIVTNACGGLDPTLRPGDVTAIESVIDLQLTMPDGQPDRVEGTDVGALRILEGERVRRVRYAALPGPQYETEAEVRVLRELGAQTVGMSTAAEVRAARDTGLGVAVLSVVTNMAAEKGKSGMEAHQDVVEMSTRASERVGGLVRTLIGPRWQEDRPT
ncbi:MAG: phosphopentomutase [Actinobacteria bacterium]|nr:phosphopentomutase [Actinomycetota bacterium]